MSCVDRPRVRKALEDAVFGLDQAARMQDDVSVRRSFQELADRTRTALDDLDRTEET